MILNRYGVAARPLLRPEMLAQLSEGLRVAALEHLNAMDFMVPSRLVDQFGRPMAMPLGGKVGETIAVKVPQRFRG